jgi:hypothetical protein
MILPGLIYLLFATGPATKYFTKLIWFAWGQLAFDGLFLIFWLCAGAAMASNLSCSQLCGYCAAFGEDYTSTGHYIVDDLCACYGGSQASDSFNRRLSKRLSFGDDIQTIKAFGKLSKKVSKLGLDWFML